VSTTIGTGVFPSVVTSPEQRGRARAKRLHAEAAGLGV